MTVSPKSRKRQRGAALIIFVAALILGVAWYTMDALGKASTLRAEREVVTGRALQEAKRALLAHVAQYAARSNTADPGQLPCPEAVSLSTPGAAAGSCSASALELGRLPWKTLGINQLRDGEGEPLWYMMRGFRDPPINFATPGQVTYNGAAVVALIIAPGRPVNTLADPGTPPAGCSKLDQYVANRNFPSLDPANFLECGVTTGNITSPGDAQWTNDRVIAITAAEWAQAIAGPVADRLQREVAPALADWRATQSNTTWGATFLPGASTFSNPALNPLCGTYGTREGLMPVARSASSTCTNWTGGSATSLLGLAGPASCAQAGNNYECTYTQGLSVLGIGSARVSARALNAGQSFRGRVSAADIYVDPNSGAVSNFSLGLDLATGDALIQFDVTFLVALGTNVTVRIPNLPDAALLADPRMAWFVNNDWARHTYYSIAPGSQLNAPSGCTFAGDVDCMTLNGLPAGTGSADNKRFVVALMGPGAVDTQSQPSNNYDDYIESRTDSMTYHQERIDAVFNDRLATCPFQYTPAVGAPVTLCN